MLSKEQEELLRQKFEIENKLAALQEKNSPNGNGHAVAPLVFATTPLVTEEASEEKERQTRQFTIPDIEPEALELETYFVPAQHSDWLNQRHIDEKTHMSLHTKKYHSAFINRIDAVAESKRTIARRLMQRVAKAVNKDWTPDWNDKRNKAFISYINNEFVYRNHNTMPSPFTVYFRTEKCAKIAVHYLHEMKFKDGSSAAEYLFDGYEPDEHMYQNEMMNAYNKNKSETAYTK